MAQVIESHDFYPKDIKYTPTPDGKLTVIFSDSNDGTTKTNIDHYILSIRVDKNKPDRPSYIIPTIDFDIKIYPDEFTRGEKMLYDGKVYDFGYSVDHFSQVDPYSQYKGDEDSDKESDEGNGKQEVGGEPELIRNVILYNEGESNAQDSISVPRSSVTRKFPHQHVYFLDFFKKGTRLDVSMMAVNKKGVRSCRSPKTRETIGGVLIL